MAGRGFRNIVVALSVAACGSLAAAQIPFEDAARDLASADPGTRFRAAQLLKEAAYPEAAVPMATLVTDPEDVVQLEAIAAELNIFLSEKIVPRKRVGFVIEIRNTISAEAAFSGGPDMIGPRPVPIEVLTALRTAARDDNPRVAIEALFAFGALASQPAGEARTGLLGTSAPDLAAMLGARSPAFRHTTLRVIDRVFERRAGDPPVDQYLGDALVHALNERDGDIRIAAIQALGHLRYDRAIQALTDLFEHHQRGDLAEAALDALARIAHASSVPLFTAQLTSRSGAVKGIAIEGLARAGDRSKWPEVEAALGAERGDGPILAGRFASVLLSNGSLDPLTEALSRPKLRDQARGYLIEIAPGRTQDFSRHAQDPDPQRRADIADILGLAADPGALPLVESLTKDGAPQVAAAATRALARLRAAARGRT